MSVLLKDPALTTAEPQTLADEVDRSVKSLDSKLVIPVDMATAFMTQIAGLEGYQPEDAAKLADQQVKGLAAMGQMFRITAMEDNAITSSLQYAEGQVTLNGQKMPLDEFAGMFGFTLPAAPRRRTAKPCLKWRRAGLAHAGPVISPLALSRGYFRVTSRGGII
jgi:uncharacterized protein YdgA (DUF945 family)